MNVYGIKNCDTVKKTLKFLESKGKAFTFVRDNPLSSDQIQNWLDAVGQETLLNTRSTTWRNLSESERTEDGVSLLLKHPTLIKRPVVEVNQKILVGFKAVEQEIG